MNSNLFIIWDFDAAIGQINSTYPYNFHEETIYKEIMNVETILKLSLEYELPMIFAITGFAAEEGVYPYHTPELIKNIHNYGHEIASHSWKHEWLPFLERKQLKKTLNRSKSILEKCIGEKDTIQGFVPPFSRPMTWLKKGALSLGDRAIGPNYECNDIEKIVREVQNSGYKWMRVTYVPIYEKIFKTDGNTNLNREWLNENEIICVPNNYVGFDEKALEIVELANKKKSNVVISGHPSGLSRNGPESLINFKLFLNFILKERDKNNLSIQLLKNVISKKNKNC